MHEVNYESYQTAHIVKNWTVAFERQTSDTACVLGKKKKL